MGSIYVGRQPIFDGAFEVVAYELLFRDDDVRASATVTNPDAATAGVMLNTFVEIGLDRIVGDRQAYINLPRNFVIGHYPVPLPHDRVVLELLEGMRVDDALVEGVRDLAERGYTIALDDFAWSDEMRPLVELADIVKLDVLEHDPDALAHQVDVLRRFDVTLLAEKVETEDVLARCCELGFDLYQGYFLSRPSTVTGSPLRAGRHCVERLLGMLARPRGDLDEIAEVVRQDVVLTWNLLRWVQSAPPGTGATGATDRSVQTVSDALRVLGPNGVRQWAGMVAHWADDGAGPTELATVALVRGRMCEILARRMAVSRPDKFYLAGMLSVLMDVAGRPAEEVLEGLPLSRELARALVHRAGTLGRTVQCVRNYERGFWDRVVCPGVEAEAVTRAYLDAVTWANRANADGEAVVSVA